MIGELVVDSTYLYSLGVDFRHLGQPNFERLGSLIERRESKLQTVLDHREDVTGYTTYLLRAGVAERELPRGKHVLASIINGTWREDFRGNGVLQSGDQLHVESEWEDFVAGQNNYRTPRILSTRVAK